ncbi:hypothetical protein GCK72_021590 [Caenorhabditis remanei]|uniref:Uncharacterized protein n=1 Tax=Caenorhabditis remanei TaxID=31234 RepID=A0A6A5GK29_CAERE|nr:hypothetical protein GCK72_021590 [Caenorhabditis remanei]KAF1755023.1 hypothetical protein GCK72_021590 [Caenorhabditis remanei]
MKVSPRIHVGPNPPDPIEKTARAHFPPPSWRSRMYSTDFTLYLVPPMVKISSRCTHLVLLGLRVGSDGESIKSELPVGLGGQWNVGDLGVAVDIVDSSVGDESTGSSLGDGELTVEPDGEEFSVQLWENVLHWWGNLVDSECWPSQSEDSVNWLVSEDLSQVSGDSEFLGLDGGRLGGVELLLLVSRVWVSVASLGCARGVNDPQVGGSSVQNDGGWLSWSSEGDVSEVEVVKVVDEWLGSSVQLLDTGGVLGGQEGGVLALLDELGTE